jgi:hypothetical protein
MPLPANFSNFGKSGNTAALNSRQDNFANFSNPPQKNIPPAKIPEAVKNPDNPKNDNNTSDSGTFNNTGGASNTTGTTGTTNDTGNMDDGRGNPYDYDPSEDGTASNSDVQKAADETAKKVSDIVDTSKDVAKYLSMADAAVGLANLGNAFLNGVPLANDASRLSGDVNQYKMDALQLQSNVNSGLNNVQQGMQNRNRGQIQAGLNQLEASKTQAASIDSRGKEIQSRAQNLQSKAANFEKTSSMLQTGSQALGYGSAGASLFGQGYQAATTPSAENIGSVFSGAAQTGLKVVGDFTSFVSPVGAQIAGSTIQAGTSMGVKAGQGASPTEVGLAAVNFFGGSAYQYAKQANFYAGQGNEAKAAEYATYAAIDVARIGAAASGIGAPFTMVGAPVAMGFTAFGSSLAQGGSFAQSAVYGTDVGLANSAVGKILTAANQITGAKQGENLWFNAQQPATGAIRTIDAPLASTTMMRDPSTGRLGFNYNPSLGAEFRAQGALVQQVQPLGTNFSSTSLQIAAQKQAAIRAQINTGSLSTNFAKE